MTRGSQTGPQRTDQSLRAQLGELLAELTPFPTPDGVIASARGAAASAAPATPVSRSETRSATRRPRTGCSRSSWREILARMRTLARLVA